MDYNKIIEMLNADELASDSEWNEAEQYLALEAEKEWQDFLERAQVFDDAYHIAPNRNIAKAVRGKGTSTEYVLVKDGEIVPAEIVSGAYGNVWCVKDAWGKDGNLVEWVNVSVAATFEKQNAFYAKKGYQMALASFRVRFGRYGTYLDRSTGKLEEGLY